MKNGIVTLLLLGAGGRGTIYARFAARMPDKARIVGVAEPREFFRQRIVHENAVPPEYVFSDWKEAARRPRFADAVVISTLDGTHEEMAVTFASLGYHILIEKPLALTPEDCLTIADAVRRNGVILSVCHVMRYAQYTEKMRQLISSGRLGALISVRHAEPVGFWRYAHSYVRGNWRKEEDSSCLLLAKSIHDLDWLNYVVGRKCTHLSSFGGLMFFRAENRPENAAERCLDCSVPGCPYHAPKFYLERFRSGIRDYIIESVASPLTEENILEAMRSGPYGRCVFACDNNVADHQTVSLEFEGGTTAVFTLSGCSAHSERTTTIFGSLAELCFDGSKIELLSYADSSREVFVLDPDDDSMERHHNYGDRNCFESFIDAVRNEDPSRLKTGLEEALDSYMLTFAAERARKERRVISMEEFRRSVEENRGKQDPLISSI